MKKLLITILAAAVMAAAPGAFAAGSGDDDVKPMTAAQLAQYRAERDAAKAQWAKMTPQQQAATIQSARTKRLADLTAIERYGQNNDMMQETAKQSAAIKAQSDAAKAAYAKLTPQQREALRQAAWKKKRADLTAMEAAGQNNDTDPDVIP
jgi:hypothetical protein